VSVDLGRDWATAHCQLRCGDGRYQIGHNKNQNDAQCRKDKIYFGPPAISNTPPIKAERQQNKKTNQVSNQYPVGKTSHRLHVVKSTINGMRAIGIQTPAIQFHEIPKDNRSHDHERLERKYQRSQPVLPSFWKWVEHGCFNAEWGPVLNL
jgi:hypothetical protein